MHAFLLIRSSNAGFDSGLSSIDSTPLRGKAAVETIPWSRDTEDAGNVGGRPWRGGH